jgi:toxin ParE1/3/4
MRLRFSKQSITQLSEVRTYIALRSPEIAELVRLRILTTIERLVRLPRLGRVGRRQGTREMRVSGLPFVVVYRMDIGDDDELVILGIFHAAQDR